MLTGEQCQPQAVHWHPELTRRPGPGRSLRIPARSAELLSELELELERELESDLLPNEAVAASNRAAY